MLLNDKQSQIVEHSGSPLLVIAGAGSGKTRCIISKLEKLLKDGVDINNILAITFTNKAADEMINRASKFCEVSKWKCWISTFHSFCYRIILANSARLDFLTMDGYPIELNDKKNKRPSICTSSQSLSAMKRVQKEISVKDNMSPQIILSGIERLKNRLAYPGGDLKIDNHLKPYYEAYQNFLNQFRLMDFNDLIAKTVLMLKSDPRILKVYQKQFKYIFVDEYQDVNNAQFQLIKLLYNPDLNYLMVVGDDSQSIYKFRDSDPSFIINFDNNFFKSEKIILDQNYRSTQKILSVANHVILNNKTGIKKNLWTDNEDGENIVRCQLDSDEEEARFVVREIKKSLDFGGRYDDNVVIYRLNSQGLTVARALASESIPFKVLRGISFFETKEIKDILSYLKFINNPFDALSFDRCVQIPKRGIGSSMISSIVSESLDNERSIMDIIKNHKKKQLREFYELINSLDSFSDNYVNIIKKLIDRIDYKKYLSETERSGQEKCEQRIKNIDSLCDIRVDDGTLDGFLKVIALSSEFEKNEDKNQVILSTAHSVKGLEFENVFVIGMNKYTFPHHKMDEDIEEARRLFYVAITRARKKLFITNTSCSNKRGQINFNEPSPFLSELPKDELINAEEKDGNLVEREGEKW